MVSRLNFDFPNPPLRKNPKILLKDFPFTLPEKYLCLLKKHDGGGVDYNFKYFSTSFNERISGSIGGIFGLDCDYNDNLLLQYKDLPDFFPKNLVPFGEDGGGNFMCFDYRKKTTSSTPTIVHWFHEEMENKSVSFLAKDFEEFVSMLREPEDKSEISEKDFEEWLSNIPGRSA